MVSILPQCLVCKDFQKLVLSTLFFPLPKSLTFGIDVIVTLWAKWKLEKCKCCKCKGTLNTSTLFF